MSNADGLLMGKPPFQIILYGAKHSGKSVLLKYLTWHYRDYFAYIVVFCGTSDVNESYSYLPSKYVYSEYKPDVLRNIIEKQSKFKKQGKNVHALIIWDDCLGQGFDWRKEKDSELVKLASSNRHYNISIAISTQSPKMIPPVFRANVDFAFIFRNLHQAVESLYEILAPMPKKEWVEFCKKNTANYKIIMFSSREPSLDRMLSIFSIPPAFLEKTFKLLY